MCWAPLVRCASIDWAAREGDEITHGEGSRRVSGVWHTHAGQGGTSQVRESGCLRTGALALSLSTTGAETAGAAAREGPRLRLRSGSKGGFARARSGSAERRAPETRLRVLSRACARRADCLFFRDSPFFSALPFVTKSVYIKVLVLGKDPDILYD